MDQTLERWLPVVGYEGYYEVSDQGRVRSVERYIKGGHGCRALRKSKTLRLYSQNGYLYAELSRSGKSKRYAVHRLVLLAFIGPRPDDLCARHLNGQREDNTLANLDYGSYRQNSNDRYAHGTASPQLNTDQVTEIRLLATTGTDRHSLARQYGVSPMTISLIKGGHTWKHLLRPPVDRLSPLYAAIAMRFWLG
jgi:hypothetical protein